MEDCSSVLKLLLIITCVASFSSSYTHTLQYLCTVNGHSIAVGLVDGEQCVYYDGHISKMIPQTEWMKKIKDDDRHYWDSETQRMTDQQDWFHAFLYLTKQRFIHTEDHHTLQRMYGCELDDDGATRGYHQYGYDGEDFFSLDLTTGTWTADNDKAKSFIKHWDPKGAEAKYWKDYLETDCIHQLKKFVSHGRETLERKVLPEVSVFQKHSPSPEVVCHATGFFPKAVMITWQKDRKDVYEDVDLGETLPNQDGSFQKRIILKVSAEELQKHTYTCVVQHSSLEKEIRKDVPKGGGSGGAPIAIITAVVVSLIALVAVVAGIVVWKKKNSGFKPLPPSSEGDSSTNNSGV